MRAPIVACSKYTTQHAKSTAAAPLHQFMAPLDSLADVSCISFETVKLLAAEIIPLPKGAAKCLALAAKGNLVERKGRARLEIRCGDRTITHNFDIMDMEIPMLLGLDIFPRLGFYVGGVPTHWPGPRPGSESSHEARQAEEWLHERQSPWCTEDQIEKDELKILLDGISDQLASNTAIDPQLPACPTIPEAVLRLPMDLTNARGSATYRKQYSPPKAAKAALGKAMDKWDRQHCFETADEHTDFNSAYLAVPKKDLTGGKTDWRICFDFRHINALINREGFSNARVPRIDELLSSTEGFTHASLLDLTGAYQQLPVAPEDRHKTAFTFNGRHLQHARWPMGLTPATAQFQKVMEIVLEGIDGVRVYIDDVAVVTKGTVNDHLEVLKQVLERLNHHQLRLNVDKCHFGYKRISLLGHRLTGNTRSADPAKVAQAIEWPQPTSGKEMMRFLGFMNFLRDYIPEYAKIAKPLDELRSTRRFTMTGKQQSAFAGLTAALSTAPVLKTPLPGVQFQVATDASQSGLGAVLYQLEEGGVTRFISFASKSLNGAQRNYPATKRELLGVIFALRTFSLYLLGSRFVLYTDHQALTSIFTQSKLSYVVENWVDVLLEYDFEVRHRPGVSMVLPDALSRLYSGTAAVEELAEEKFADAVMGPGIRNLSVAIPDEVTSNANAELAGFIRERFNKNTVGSKDEQISMLRAAHAVNHFGAEALFKNIWHRGYFWDGLRAQCDDVAGSCHSCLQYNVKRKGYHPTRSLRADNPWDHIAVDCAVDLPVSQAGNSAILIMVDVASRFVVTKPLPNTQQSTVARALFEVFTLFGPPKAMQSDRGSEFISQVLKKLCKAAGIDHRLVAAYNPQANGLAERTVRTVKETLKKRLGGSLDRWDEALPGATFAINTKEHKLTKTAPFTMFYGRSASLWEDYSASALIFGDYEKSAKEWVELTPDEVEALTKRNEDFNTHVRQPVIRAGRQRQDVANASLDKKRLLMDKRIRAGSLVYIEDQNKTSKWEPFRAGPFLVDRQDRRSKNFWLNNLSGKVLPRSFPPQQLIFVTDTNLSLAAADGSVLSLTEPRGEILKILKDRPAADGSTEYLVSWRIRSEPDTWLPATSFDSAAALANYHRKKAPFKKKKKVRVERKQPTRRAKRQ